MASERDGGSELEELLDAGELALAEIADWGPAEEWVDWLSAAG